MMNQAGFSRVCITPTEPLPLGGYPGREAGHTSVSHPVYVRAACLSIGEAPPVYLITADLCGWGPSLCSEIYARFAEEMGVPREHVMLNASHGHCTPITLDVLPLFYRMNETMTAAVARYTRRVIDATLEAAKAAKASQEQCTLDFSFGFAGFGVNRRRVRGQGFHLTSATDPDVPVLVAKRRDGSVAGIIFGYACHTTSQFGFVLDPDYGGWASSELEAVFPGAEAMFVAGCGGDVNPLPRYRPGLETTYGHVLACAVLDAMGIDGLRSGCITDGFRLDQQFSAGVRDLSLPLEPPLPEEDFHEGAADPNAVWRRGLYEHQIRIRREGRVPTEVPYAVQAWNLGGLQLIGLAGEPVVDYSLKLREQHGWGRTWVAGYCDDLVNYVPTERVRDEGGYEGRTGMMEYGWPSAYAAGLESRIVGAVDEMLKKTAL